MAEHRYVPPVTPVFAPLALDRGLKAVLEERGITSFYSHQAEAVTALREGRNVVVMTPTGSGKSLIYNIPVLESIMQDPWARALYVFPLKGLEQDQLKTLAGLAEAAGVTNAGAVYDGDTSQYRRRKIRENLPNVIFTNPDMLHYALNAFHSKWEDFFRNLKYVVIDEVHAYRGVFGSNVSQVIRRMRRIARRWGSDPRFIACSATIANPGRFTEALTGLPFTVVERNGAPRGGVHFVFADPVESAYPPATRLFVRCLQEGFRTVAFTKARKITELMYAWASEQAPEFSRFISPYRAGFLPAERREIEQKLFSGELKGVISTSALELGVDIGGLDVCILVGYPGSIASTWQRAGRVGRRGGESLVVMVPLRDALDQYLMRHPEAFFGKSHEAAVMDPMNENILKGHLPCAAREVFLMPVDHVYDMEALNPVIDELVEEGSLTPARKGGWRTPLRMPHREVEIRAVGRRFGIFDREGKVGELSGFRVLREAFPGAVYLHRGRQYIVEELDLEAARIRVRKADVRYYTQVRTDQETDILEEKGSKRLQGYSLYEGRLRIRHQVVGYERKNFYDREVISTHELRMPEYLFETDGLWVRIDKSVMEKLELAGYDVAGTLHAFEHAAISVIPLFALCDKNDIGGLSYPLYPAFRESTVFIYDGYEGGVGLSRRVFDVLPEWFSTTLRVVEECPCEDGCPSCVQDSQCGSGNDPLDKQGAGFLTEKLLKGVAE
jgi:DEAD/DEAH box helicase domain-containing protein